MRISTETSIWRARNSGERSTVEEAIRSYTVNPAYANFEENLKGTIEEGELADMVVLSDDPFKTKTENIRDIKVLMTVVGGKMSTHIDTIE